MADETSSTSLLDLSPLPYGLPSFAQISADDLRPTIEQGMAEQLQAVAAIVEDPEPPTFENTLAPLELSGVRLSRATRVFEQLTAADTSDELDALETELAPKLAAQRDAILLNAGLYERVRAVSDSAAAGDEQLDAEAAYLVQRWLTWFQLAGAALNELDRARLKGLNERLAMLQTEFKMRLQADTKELALEIDDVGELDGLTSGEVSASAAAATARGREQWLSDQPGAADRASIPLLADARGRARTSERRAARPRFARQRTRHSQDAA